MRPADDLMALSAACRIHFTWFGTRKTLTNEQIREAAEQFDANANALSASKRLLNTKHKAYKAVNGIKSECRNYWRHVTLPWPEPGIRLLRRSSLTEFQEKLAGFRAQLEQCVAELNANYAELKVAAEGQLGSLFDPNDYPPSLSGQFALDWDFPSVEPPPYLATLNPELYEQEQARLKARFEEAARLAEQAFAEELATLVSHMAERITDGPEGRKTFRASTLTNLEEFFERFRNLSVSSNSELERLVDKAKATLAGVDVKDIRTSEETRAVLAQQMASLSAEIDQQLVTAPRRRIIGIQANDEELEETNAT